MPVFEVRVTRPAMLRARSKYALPIPGCRRSEARRGPPSSSPATRRCRRAARNHDTRFIRLIRQDSVAADARTVVQRMAMAGLRRRRDRCSCPGAPSTACPAHSRRVDVRYGHREQVVQRIGPRRRQLVSQAQRQGEFRADSPCVVHESRLGVALELALAIATATVDW